MGALASTSTSQHIFIDAVSNVDESKYPQWIARQIGSATWDWSNQFRVLDAKSAVDVFDRHGFAIFKTDLAMASLDALHQQCLDTDQHFWSTRGPGRFSINAVGNAELSGFKELIASCNLNTFLTHIICYGLRQPPCDGAWSPGVRGGDVVQPHTLWNQEMHSDAWYYKLNHMQYGFYIAVSVACCDILADNAPIRAIPWSICNHYRDFPVDLSLEAPTGSTSLLLHKGEVIIRDVRACHAGSANFTDETRMLPGFQVNGPQAPPRRWTF